MTAGEALAGVIIKVAAIGHSILNNWVNVTAPAGNGGGQLDFALLPEGVDFAQWAADMVGTYAALLNQLTHVPMLGASIAKFLVILMW